MNVFLNALAAALPILGLALAVSARAQLPIFDAHLHYNDEAQSAYPVPEVLRLFRDNGVTAILATSRPNDGTRALARAAAADLRATRVVPFIRPYRNHADRQTWFNDPEIYTLIETELARGIDYRGIGEFHVFGRDADTPWIKRIVTLALAHNLWLHAHCDEQALELLLAQDAKLKVIWAHSGFTTPPAKLAQYFERYPRLVGELSYRHDITRDGKLADEWRALLLAHPDRFVLGSDTWVNERWSRYGEIMAGYRGWLGQLPPQVAAQIASGNGERLFPP